MSYANVLELERCVEACIEYCRSQPEHAFAQHFLPLLEHARRKYHDNFRDTDASFIRWRREAIEDKIVWKELARELKSIQKMLREVNAIGSPQTKVAYWDTEILTASVDEMSGYLRAHVADLPEAEERIEQLQRKLEAARSEDADEHDTLEAFRRMATFRTQALGTLDSTLTDFRNSMRRHLGKHDATYQAIPWPMSLSPDQRVI